MESKKTIGEVLQELLDRHREKGLEDYTNYDSPLWAVITALRGPDEDNCSLKYLTTARIRGILNLKEGNVAVNSDPLNDIEIERRNRGLKTSLEHFSQHFQEALHALEHLGYNVPEAEKLPSRFLF